MNWLAQIPTTPALEVTAWLGCLFFLAAGANQVVRLAQGLKGHPPAEELQLALASKESVKEADDRRRVIYRMIDELGKEMNASVRGISNNVASLQTASDLTNQHLMRLETKLDRLVERE